MNRSFAVSVVLSALVLASCGGESTEAEPETTPQETVSGAVNEEADQERTSDEPAAAVVETPKVAAVMPDVVGLNLQLAQDTIQDAGVFFSRSEDATGQDRMQIMDRNWVVVAQEPAPGTPIEEGDPLLYVVKKGESVESAATAGEVRASTAVMPDVVGLNLQLAQDTIQDAGVFFSRSEDATGQDRMQIMDRNWVVVAQEPAPGTPIEEGDPLLYVVKKDEL